MKNNLVSLLAVLFLSTATFAQEARLSPGGGQSRPHHNDLVGTWDARVSVRNCATGMEILSFLSTGNFNEGGTFSGITSGSSPTARTSERGVWEHLNGRNYRFRFKAYLYDPSGVATSYQVVTHNIRLSRDREDYTSEGISEVFSMAGAPIGTGCSTSVATRMTID